MTNHDNKNAPQKLLTENDPPAIEWIMPKSRNDVLLVCEHAGLAFPEKLGKLGVEGPLDEMHIAYDIGAKRLALKMAEQLGCGLILQNYSRLVIDCNRPPLTPTSIPEISDHIEIVGNQNLRPEDKQARIDEIFAPFDALCARETGRPEIKLIMSIHSFTPQMDNFDRPWQIAFLYNEGEEYARQFGAFIQGLRPEINIGYNEPYQVDRETDWLIPQYAEPRGVAHALIEIRNDHLRNDADITALADDLSNMIVTYMENLNADNA